MSIDLSHTSLAIEAREEGLREGLREGRRDMVRRVLNSRFGDPDLTERVAAIPDAMLPDAIDRAATASAGDFTAWLDELQN